MLELNKQKNENARSIKIDKQIIKKQINEINKLDEISACNDHRVEFEDDIEGDDISEEKVNENHKKITSKEKIQDSTLNQPAKKTKVNDHNVSPPVFDMSFGGEEFDVPPEKFEELTPLNYFPMFWNKDLNKLDLIAKQTNLYSTQKDGKSRATTEDEIKQFVGIQMLMSLFDLPSYMMYQARETCYPPIVDVMSINRYKKPRQYLHFSDNSKIDDAENKKNKLYKIQPVIDHVRNNCCTIKPEIETSIDEQIIPAKTKYGGIRQYNPKKPVKQGFKKFVRSASSGIMYDFFTYCGKQKVVKNVLDHMLC